MKRIVTLSLVLGSVISGSFAAVSAVPASGEAKAVAVAPVKIGDAAPIEITASAPVVAKELKASEIFIPLDKTGKTVSLQELTTMNASDLEQMTGKKMGWMRRMEFKLAQRKLRHSINEDGTLRNKKLAMLASRDMDGDTGFHLGGFALGLFLGLIGVLIAYLIEDEKQDNRVKWSWIGCAVLVGIILLSLL